MDQTEKTKVLLVDDNAANILSLKAILSDAGELISASSGVEALRLILQHEFAVILLDVHMPGMDGFETAALFRQHRRAEFTPIIFITARNSTQADMSRGYNLGAIDYVTKPIIPEILRAKVAGFVDLYQHRRALRNVNQHLESQVRERTAQLLDSEVRFRKLSESVPVAVLLLDVNGECVYSNPRWTIMSGLSEETSRHSGWRKALHHLSEMPPFGHNPANGIGEWSGEQRIVQPNGTVCWGHSRLTLFSGSADDDPKFVLSIMDISELKEAEQKKESLEHQLRQSQKLEAVGRLAGGIAHDFNNVLAIIVSSLELALRQAESGVASPETLALARDAGMRAAAVVRQLLYFSRPQQGERKILNSKDAVADAIALLRRSIPATVEIDFHAAPDAPDILVNDTQLQQVLMNLGANAWHAMGPNGGKLDIAVQRAEFSAEQAQTIHPELQAGCYCRISVADNGSGMSAHTVSRIFEPFFTTKAQGEGSGLGLSVVHGIVQSHGGAITVVSEAGVGSTFLVYLPKGIRQVEEVEAPRPQVFAGQGQRIVVVEDEPVLALLRKQILGTLGYDVKMYLKPAEAMQQLLREDPGCDLVLTDLSMPEISGLDLAAAVHAQHPSLPILLCTGYEPALTQAQLEALGIRQVLKKPTTMELLSDAIGRTLGSLRTATRTR